MKKARDPRTSWPAKDQKGVSGPCIPENSNIDVSIDGLWIDYYKRDRTWVDGANEAGFKIGQSEADQNFA